MLRHFASLESSFSAVHGIIASVYKTSKRFNRENCKTEVDFYGCLAPT